MTPPLPILRRLTPDEVADRASELTTLKRAAYAVEAELIHDDRIPQLTETPEQLVAAGLMWHVAEIDGRIVAAVAHGRAGDETDIHRLVVHPD